MIHENQPGGPNDAVASVAKAAFERRCTFWSVATLANRQDPQFAGVEAVGLRGKALTSGYLNGLRHRFSAKWQLERGAAARVQLAAYQ
jgi:hypothetical protein